jgi:hypothetical protein
MLAMNNRIRFVVLVIASTVAWVFLPAGADASMYGDVQQIRQTLFQTFLVMAFGAAGVIGLLVCVLRMQHADEEVHVQSSVVVPLIKQESNIVRDIIHS